METQIRYELYLNHISASEYTRYKETFEDYKKQAVLLLQYHNRYIFEDDLLESFKNDSVVKATKKDEPLTMEHINTVIPETFVKAGLKKKKKNDKEPINIWYNVWDSVFLIETDDVYYSLFFAYKLRNLDLFELDTFLDYQLEHWYEDDSKKFIRFVQLVFRKYTKKILDTETIQTANEWITEKERQQKEGNLSGADAIINRKGIPKRKPNDNLTKLNQEQTALLIHYLQKGNIILRDEYLKNKPAGQAFSILTNYSDGSLRQLLNQTELNRIATKKNLTELENALTRLNLLIKGDIKTKKA